MRKKRTSLTIARILRQGFALFLALAAGWLLWLTADWRAAGEALRSLADNAGLATALLSAELVGDPTQPLAGLNRSVLAQSSLLTAGQAQLEGWQAQRQQATPSPALSPPPLFPPPAATPSQPPTTTAPEGIVGRTMVAGTSSRYVTGGGLYVYNYTDYALDIPGLEGEAPASGLADGEGPQVLIYHSHTTEAYTMDGTDIYEESDSYRTTDPAFNVIRVGEEMKRVFEAHGLEVIHDRTLYDYPVYSNSYSRSLEGVEAILKQHPTIRLVLDVHRDALEGTEGTVYKTVAGTVEGCAQVMLVVGTDAGGQSHDGWRKNLSLALGLQRAVQEKHGTLIRPIVLRSSRFNQHLSAGSLLVEVGSHGNTLQEALTAARLTAEAMAGRLA